MSRIHVKRISLQAFRAFQNKQISPELPTTGLVGIRGRDVLTGVSSGTGKSTVPLAITYAFGFCPFPAVAQQNWHTKLPMQVELELDTPQGPAILRRGKEFSLTVNGTTTKGSAKDVEEAVTRLWGGLPPNLRKALTYRQQQKRGAFLAMTDGEKKEFLSTLLGASELEEQIANSVTLSNKLQVEADQLAKVVEYVRAGAPPVPVPVDLTALRAEREKQEKARVDAVVELSMYPGFVEPETQISALQSQKEEANRRIWAVDKAFRKKRDDFYEEIVARNGDIDGLKAQIAATGQLKNQIAALERESIKLSQARCPTCSQEWENAESKLKENETTIKRLNQEIDKANRLQVEVTALETKRRAELTQWQTMTDPTLEKLVEVRSMLEKKIAVETAQATRARELYDRELHHLKMRVQILEGSVKTVDSQIELAGYEYNGQLARRTKWEEELAAKEAELAAKKPKAAEEADYAAALKSYLGSLFDEVLQQISNETNALLRDIPNTPTTTVTFVSESVTAKGTPRQEIKPVIIKNGATINLESGISGGQLESVELAVDLSISKVIGERTGTRPGFMIFDESFAAHCPKTKESCMQVLKKAAQDCLIIVVDHATEFKDYFDSFIDIEADHDVSKFA